MKCNLKLASDMSVTQHKNVVSLCNIIWYAWISIQVLMKLK
jgi:hypothetical protein